MQRACDGHWVARLQAWVRTAASTETKSKRKRHSRVTVQLSVCCWFKPVRDREALVTCGAQGGAQARSKAARPGPRPEP